MTYVITPAKRPSLGVKGKNSRFPVARVFGIGRNYSETSETEEKDKNKVVLFMKDAYMISPATEGIVYPEDTYKLRYEIELIVAIDKEGQNISFSEAENYIYGYAIGVDFTKYDAQGLAKQNGWPWDKGKSFFGCAPCSKIIPKNDFSLNNNKIWLKKNDIEVQSGSINQMIWSVPEIISLISSSFGLLPGDLIFTGTPKGVGMVNKGDSLEGCVDGLEIINVKIQ